MEIAELLAFGVKNKASDLHLSAGLPPMIRVHGDVRRINVPALSHDDVHGMVYDIMNDGQRKHYEENLECDFSFEIPNLARFRVNAFNHQRGAGVVIGAGHLPDDGSIDSDFIIRRHFRSYRGTGRSRPDQHNNQYGDQSLDCHQ